MMKEGLAYASLSFFLWYSRSNTCKFRAKHLKTDKENLTTFSLNKTLKHLEMSFILCTFAVS